MVVAPKTILRLPAATSTLEDMLPGKTFLPVIGDKKVKGDKVKKIIFCSGKHFYTLDKERDSRKLEDVALVRIEVLLKSKIKENSKWKFPDQMTKSKAQTHQTNGQQLSYS